MQLTIFAAGSRGDIQPCISLGQGLRRAGFATTLAAPAIFAGFVQEHGLAFHPPRRRRAADHGKRGWAPVHGAGQRQPTRIDPGNAQAAGASRAADG